MTLSIELFRPVLIDLDTGLDMEPPLEEFEAEGSEEIRSMAFSPDGSLLVAAGDSGTVAIWDTATRKHILGYPRAAIAFSVPIAAWRSYSFSNSGNSA